MEELIRHLARLSQLTEMGPAGASNVLIPSHPRVQSCTDPEVHVPPPPIVPFLISELYCLWLGLPYPKTSHAVFGTAIHVHPSQEQHPLHRLIGPIWLSVPCHGLS
jgi:hypothetical protein